MSPRRYPALLHKASARAYGVSFPDFPGCISAGATPEEALANGAEALAFHAAGMAEDGDAFPKPTTLEAAKKGADRRGFWAVALVAVALPARSQRINITLPDDLISKVDAASANRSAFIAEALRAKLAGERGQIAAAKPRPGPTHRPARKRRAA